MIAPTECPAGSGSVRRTIEVAASTDPGSPPESSSQSDTVTGTAEAALARIRSRASARVKATCVAPTPESPWDAASLPASPQRPTTIASPANRARSRRTW